jgi:putative membrane protein
MKRSFSDFANISLKGMAMGAVEFLPGISGGTIAFVTGIYEELLETIKGALPAFKHLLGKKPFKQRFSDFWTALNGNFIVALVLGIVVAAGLTVVIVKQTLNNYPILFHAFIFGLIVASVVLVYKKVSKWTWICYLLGLVGVGLAFLLPVQPYGKSGDEVALWYMFICGCLASCAYILPGTSGTFILYLMGTYYAFIEAFHRPWNIPCIVVFFAGCLTGLIAFSNFLSWLLKKYHDLTVALLTGFIIGSLRVIWPWKDASQNVLPSGYESQTMLPAMTTEAILACVLGVALVLGIEFIAKLISNQKNTGTLA